MSSTEQGREPTEEELRAAYEQELKQIRVEQIVLENIATVVNLGLRRTGLAPGTEDERDPEQVRVAIEAVRLQMPLLEAISPPNAARLREALSQLQLAYVRMGGGATGAAEPAHGAQGAPGGTGPAGGAGGGGPAGTPPAGGPGAGQPGGPAQRSGRLWVPRS